MGFFSSIKKFFSAGDDSGETDRKLKTSDEKKSSPAAQYAITNVETPPQEPETQEITADASETFAEKEIPAEIIREETPEAIVTELEEKITPTPLPEAENSLEPQDLDNQKEQETDTTVQEELIIAETLPQSTGTVPTTQEIQPVNNNGDATLLLRLREANPGLGAWLNIILENIDTADDVFWHRLRFLLQSLQAPQDEIDRFMADFHKWLDKMEYTYVDEFRSELQYRLAIALDLEDEEDERNRLLLKLGAGLAKTREEFGRQLHTLFASHGELNQAFWDEMEELLIMSDLGYETSLDMVERLKNRCAREYITKSEDLQKILQLELEDIFKTPRRIQAVNKPEVVLMVGVNGAGKTTTIAKLAYRERMQGKKVLIAAGDTFRAAAIEQLQVWADRVGAEFYAKTAGSDPASVAWEAMDYALKNDIDTVFIDTAGRLQTKVNLMEELGKIKQVLSKKHAGAPHRSVLVLDATTGQNALSQAKLFNEATGVDELILTKLDGTAKGGVAISVAMQEKLPITYIGLGEKMEDLRPFNGADYARALLGVKEEKHAAAS